MLLNLFHRFRSEDRPDALYAQIVAQARQPGFYRTIGVADTPVGRFETIVVHAVLVMRRLRREGEEGRTAAQTLFDVFFADMDGNLREMGVSDLGVPKRIRRMAEAFYGRASAYDAALDSAGAEGLGAALERNLFEGAASGTDTQRMVAYMLACEARLSETPAADILAGRIDWPDPDRPDGGGKGA